MLSLFLLQGDLIAEGAESPKHRKARGCTNGGVTSLPHLRVPLNGSQEIHGLTGVGQGKQLKDK